MNDEELAACCNAFPGAVLEFPWDQPTWKVGGKMFCGRSGMGSRIMLKATHAQQEVLTQLPGITAAAYVGRYCWIEVEMGVVERAMIEDLIAESYRLVVSNLPKSKRPQVSG